MKNNSLCKKMFEGLKIFLTTISPTLCSKFLYLLVFKRKINLENPKTFNEKLMWLKLNTYYNNELIDICVDKYKVRDYIKEKKCEDSLNDLLHVYDDVNEINWNELPNKFVLKCNHASSYNIICNDKSSLNIKLSKNKLKKWLKDDFWKRNAETNYKNVPKKIVCEKYLETNDGILPNDYKIYCFNGEPKVILVCTDRDDEVKYSYFDLDWNILDISFIPSAKVEKPKSLNKMLEYSKKLSKDFPFVRIDFYELNGKAIFGEMTFSPSGCIDHDYTDKGDEILGNMLDISKYMKEKSR